MALFKTAGDQDYEALVAENRFISDVQLAIEHALRDHAVSQSELARRMDVSPARVSQMLAGNGGNLTARTVARIAHVLGLRACVNLVEQYIDGWCREEQPDEDCGEPVALTAFAQLDLGAEVPPSGRFANDPWTNSGKPTDQFEHPGSQKLVAA